MAVDAVKVFWVSLALGRVALGSFRQEEFCDLSISQGSFEPDRVTEMSLAVFDD